MADNGTARRTFTIRWEAVAVLITVAAGALSLSFAAGTFYNSSSLTRADTLLRLDNIEANSSKRFDLVQNQMRLLEQGLIKQQEVNQQLQQQVIGLTADMKNVSIEIGKIREAAARVETQISIVSSVVNNGVPSGHGRGMPP